MKKSLGEFELIKRLASRLPAPSGEGVVGIGDDAAALPTKDGVMLLTCDIALAGRHFQPGITPMADVGWKVTSSSVSDIAACGGMPASALISLGVPEDSPQADLDALYEGIAEAGAHYGFEVLGGNVTGSKELLVDCFMMGQAPRFIPRSGAQPGDVICVSGTLGDSDAGLTLLGTEPQGAAEQALLRRHLRPRARTDLVPLLQRAASAAIDISDALASELHHVARASAVQLVVEGQRVPISSELRSFAHARHEDPLQRALFGGEEYQLLFTVPPHKAPQPGGEDITVIGEVREGSGVLLDGEPLPGRGWDHLRKDQPSGGE
ncbi:MAG: thiamine-phosphate kinase [SAR324 cluster bacterium]|nr:thiamine-phosphate kinase [SAR324 cluster bacterium]